MDAERKIESIAEKAWQLTQSSNTKGQTLKQDWDTSMSLAKENGWTKDTENMAKSLEGTEGEFVIQRTEKKEGMKVAVSG